MGGAGGDTPNSHFVTLFSTPSILIFDKSFTVETLKPFFPERRRYFLLKIGLDGTLLFIRKFLKCVHVKNY